MYQQWHFSRSAKIAASLNLIRFIYASITIYQKERETKRGLKVSGRGTKTTSIISKLTFSREKYEKKNSQVLIHGQFSAQPFKGPFCLHEGGGVDLPSGPFLGQHTTSSRQRRGGTCTSTAAYAQLNVTMVSKSLNEGLLSTFPKQTQVDIVAKTISFSKNLMGKRTSGYFLV